MACKLLDLHPANLRNLHLHLTKNPFANRLPHLCGVIFIMLSHFPHGTIRSIFAKNSRFFVCTCDNSSLRADRLSCLSIPMLYHLLRLFALCGIALILKRLSPFLSFLPRNNKFVKLFIAISFANNVILNIDKTNCSHHINIYFFGRNSNVIKIRISDNVEHSAFCG